jgi:nickel/cobalt transporter (NiCoT) family protein
MKPNSGCGARSEPQRAIIGFFLLLVAGNIAAWLWALTACQAHPVLLGTAVLTYGLGLRHGFDADHIAAIDNVTRKLMQDGKRPLGVGLFFSLGHSTVVAGLSIAIAASATALRGQLDLFKAIGGTIGSLVSALFLLCIAGTNIAVFTAVYRVLKTVRNGGHIADAALESTPTSGGLLARIFGRLFRLIDHSWQMYPLGFLFGLGFDTATEIGLLGISATQATKGLSAWSILVFPALFTAGMTLVDTTEGILMLRAYSWAFVKPIRKLYYNLATTAMSIIVAVVVGGLPALDLIGDQFGLTDGGGIWGLIGALNDHFATLGLVIVGMFIIAWLTFALLSRSSDTMKPASRGPAPRPLTPEVRA